MRSAAPVVGARRSRSAATARALAVSRTRWLALIRWVLMTVAMLAGSLWAVESARRAPSTPAQWVQCHAPLRHPPPSPAAQPPDRYEPGLAGARCRCRQARGEARGSCPRSGLWRSDRARTDSRSAALALLEGPQAERHGKPMPALSRRWRCPARSRQTRRHPHAAPLPPAAIGPGLSHSFVATR